ncbi:hypothetical protein ACFV3R_03955 [Streptomyces sp. NPDC059740]|uniref:hypothetical protein n=1 Tax=Streptomyces sp. NPDC059740 TaxID=3346926 RepID=UPI00365EE5A7
MNVSRDSAAAAGPPPGPSDGPVPADRAAGAGGPAGGVPDQRGTGRLAELRGPGVAPRPLDARAIAALAANPGCHRRALLDGAGVDKARLARALGSPADYGQSPFAFARGNTFEARVKADSGAETVRLLHGSLRGEAAALEPPEAGEIHVPDVSAAGPQGRAARTALALREATARGGWSFLDHPMLVLHVAGAPAYLEPDAVVVSPDGRWTVVEIKSFPVLDGSADAEKVGAAARQAAVYALGLAGVARHTTGAGGRTPEVETDFLLVCPKDFSNLPTARSVDIRKQIATTRRQLARMAHVEDLAAQLPPGTTFDLRPEGEEGTPTRPVAELTSAVDAVAAAYAPECLATCELAFHCRAQARAAGSVATLGRSVRGELGGLHTVDQVLAAARSASPGSAQTDSGEQDPAAVALRRAAALRAEALAEAAGTTQPTETETTDTAGEA